MSREQEYRSNLMGARSNSVIQRALSSFLNPDVSAASPRSSARNPP